MSKPKHDLLKELPPPTKNNDVAAVVLSRILNNLVSYSTLPEMVASSLKVIAQVLPVEYILLLDYLPVQKALVALTPVYNLYSDKISLAELEQLRLGLKEPSVSGVAFLKQRAVFYNQPEVNQFVPPKRFSNLKIRSLLTVPIYLEGKVQGVCTLVNKLEGGFDELDQHLIEKLRSGLSLLLKQYRINNQLNQEQRRHIALISSAVDGYLEVSPELVITQFSSGAEELTGWTADEAIGKTCREVLNPILPTNKGEPLCNTCPLERSFHSEQPVSDVESVLRNRAQQETWVSGSYNFIEDSPGEISAGIISLRDIYRVRALSEELQEQSHQLSSLLGVNKAISRLSYIEDIYSTALEEIAKAIDFDLGTIHSVISETDELVLEATFLPHPADDEQGLALPILASPDTPAPLSNVMMRERMEQTTGSLSLSEIMRLSPSPHHCQDCESLRRNDPYMAINDASQIKCPILTEHAGHQSHLCVPIRTTERSYAVLHLASLHANAFLGSDFVLALSICRQIAVAAERSRLFAQMDKMVRTDALTGLYNKREFWERFDREIRRAARRNTPLVLVVVDLDRLKWINDYLGHSEGDKLLMKVSDLIRSIGRSSDIGFRYGGDEFCILMPDTTREEAFVAAERLRLATAEIRVQLNPEQFIIGENSLVTMSLGLASYPDDATDLDSLFEYADAAMYRAKETGKNQTIMFEATMDANRLTPRKANDEDARPERLKATVRGTTPGLTGTLRRRGRTNYLGS